MSEDNFSAETGAGRSGKAIGHSGKADSWRRHLPYLLVLALALAGVAYANMSQKSLAGYWELLALISGGVCIFTEWGKAEDKGARVRLVWTQAVHWIAVLVAMNIMLLSGVQQLLPAPATSLVLLMLLALGSFLAGLNLASLELCFLGLVLALAVPAVCVGQTIHALRHSRWSLRGRPWHNVLVRPERKVIDRIKPLRSASSGRTAG